MDLGLSGKTAIVCASSKGLGLGCALALAEEGAHVVLNGRNADSLAAAETAVRALGASGTITTVVADVTTPEGRDALLAAAPAPDILVNNAAGPPPGPRAGTERRAHATPVARRPPSWSRSLL